MSMLLKNIHNKKIFFFLFVIYYHLYFLNSVVFRELGTMWRRKEDSGGAFWLSSRKV